MASRNDFPHEQRPLMLRPLDRHRNGLPRLSALLVFLALAGGGIRSWADSQHSPRHTPVVRAVQEARPSVVNIQGRKTVRSETPDPHRTDPFRQVNGMGTGIIIDDRGYILTNYHVVENVDRIQVTLADRREFVAEFLAHDPATDLAIIKIEASQPFTVIRFGISSDLMPGEPVIAVGNAFGYEHTVTCGIISALHREVQVSATQEYRDLIQTDASINPGNSGGPLLNIEGDMIGINVAVRVGAQGIGFAIPVDEALEIASELLDAERIERFRHGVIGQTRVQEDQREFVVTGFRPESSARGAGLRVGDVVQAVDDIPIRRRLDFERALLGRSASTPVPMKIARDGQVRTVELKLAGGADGDPFEQLTWSVVGMRLRKMSDTEFRQLRSRYRGGMRITSVRSDSVAWRQGIRAGDILVGMHVWETLSPENVRYILNHAELESFQPLKFYILRGDETLYGHLQIDPGQLASRPAPARG